MWEGNNGLKLRTIKRSAKGIEVLANLSIKNVATLSLEGQSFKLSAGDMLSLSPLTFRKKDSLRAAKLLKIELPADNSPVPFELEADLSTGHELIIVPLMRGLDNTAATLTIRDLKITME